LGNWGKGAWLAKSLQGGRQIQRGKKGKSLKEYAKKSKREIQGGTNIHG